MAVTFSAPAVEQPETEPAQSAAPSTTAPLVPVVDTPDDEPEPTPAQSTSDPRSASSPTDRADNSLRMLTLVGGVLAVAAIIGGITALVVRRREDDEDDDYE